MSDNHWSNEDTMVDYLEKVLFLMPRKKEKISSLSLLNQLVIFLIDFKDSTPSAHAIVMAVLMTAHCK